MASKTVYQYDVAGRYLGETQADESPLEAGVYHLPARTTEQAPPARDTWPEGKWPRWNGISWAMTGAGSPPETPAADPLDKLARFLLANPDMLAVMDKAPSS